MVTERTSVGLDVHARSVAAAAIDGVTGERVQAKLTPSHEHIRSWLGDLPGPVAVTYEAGPTGFDLYRALTAAGIRCAVAAPSKLQRPSGDRVKTDAKDAVHLARLLRLDEITAVAIPSVDQEAARDLVRAREDCRGDLMRARHRLSKLLLRHGIVYYGGQAWTGKHEVWMRHEAQPQLTSRATRLAFDSDYEATLAVKARRDRLDLAIGEMATDSEFTATVRQLGCLRGISTLGDLVAVHGIYHGFGPDPLVALDVFRVADGKLAAHWDALTPQIRETVSGRSQVDGPAEVEDLDKTEANRVLVLGFIEKVLKGGDFSVLTDFISTEQYDQHHPEIADGLEGLGAAAAVWAEKGTKIVYGTTHRVIAEGNFVLVVTEGEFDGPVAYWDLFRVADGKIVEHWDIVVPNPETLPHDNGLF